MKTRNVNQAALLALIVILPFTGCSLKKDKAEAMNSQSNLPASGNPADEVGVAGVPGAAVPTTVGIVARIQNGVKNAAVPTAGNFRTALAQIGSNLPENTNPNLATGYDQVPLLAYAACSDVPLSAYSITGTSIAAAKPALIAAGVNILDQHTGGLASTGPLAANVAAVFGKLVDDNARISGETVQMAFISVCMTANAFGAQMMGF